MTEWHGCTLERFYPPGVKGRTEVEVRLRNGSIYRGPAVAFGWVHDNVHTDTQIVAYRILESKVTEQKKITRLIFKAEDKDDEGFIGPLIAYFEDGTREQLEGGYWLTQKEVRERADKLSITLEEDC
jgi:hypothetical protein